MGSRLLGSERDYSVGLFVFYLDFRTGCSSLSPWDRPEERLSKAHAVF
jgi:hypothetical protein